MTDDEMIEKTRAAIRVIAPAVLEEAAEEASMRKAETQGICDVGVAVDAIAEAIRQSERHHTTLASIEGARHE